MSDQAILRSEDMPAIIHAAIEYIRCDDDDERVLGSLTAAKKALRAAVHHAFDNAITEPQDIHLPDISGFQSPG